MADRLLALIDEMHVEIKLTEEDHLGFMAANFLSKQYDHLRSIILLEPSRDVILIARSMIEGLCQLLWAARDPLVLPLKWRTFSCIEDWRNLRKYLARGDFVDPVKQAAVNANLEKYGNEFFNRKSRGAREKGNPLPKDPYCRDWRCGMSIKDVCEEVGGSDLYERLYTNWSGWHHWSPGGFSASLTRQDDRLIYTTLSSTDAASALASGFQCVIQTAEITNDHLNMGFEKAIDQLKEMCLLIKRN